MTVPIFLLERITTPIGQMLLVTDDQGRLRAVDWADYEDRMLQLMRQQYRGVSIDLRETRRPSAATDTMRAYFGGDIAAIDGLDVAMGGTDFQRQVWAALRTIPHGSTLSYGELAARIGRPRAVRAVGLANGANPISVVIPCHRVIGGNGVLTGYGGGLHRKQWLLEHEHALPVRRAIPQTAPLPGF
ncbi:methylated-DNA--[protein]-cysteine S-methyltransferase [Alcaligenaceae bacterium]|nr:methylated-DNA--[protein]-cysteine S-methyltransferase [Alcaligenaceae bacterium]